MARLENIEDFYRNKLDWVPDYLREGIGHFNLFRLDDFVGACARPTPYNPKDYYKISLMIGRSKYHFADKTIEIKESALVFANPMIPYEWVPLDDEQKGWFCVFTEGFFSQFGNIREYPVFKPGESPIYFLTREEVAELLPIYERMQDEIQSDYVYKYDVLRNLIFELIHRVMRMSPVPVVRDTGSNANARIASLFIELLERQFPIESPQQYMRLRTPADFAGSLSVHINHLNRAIKATTGKTTSICLSERVIQEARVLLKRTDWNVAEIGYCLGFEEPSHFISFFRKNMEQTPGAFRG